MYQPRRKHVTGKAFSVILAALTAFSALPAPAVRADPVPEGTVREARTLPPEPDDGYAAPVWAAEEHAAPVDPGLSYLTIKALMDGAETSAETSAERGGETDRLAGENTDDEEAPENPENPDGPSTIVFPLPQKFPAYDTEEEILTYLTDRYPATRSQTADSGIHYGSCWAHAAAALAEFYMICHGLRDANGYADRGTDYSELQLAYFAYHNGPEPITGPTGDSAFLDLSRGSGRNFLNFGGNLSYAAQSLMRRRGYAADAGELLYANAENVLENGLPETYAESQNLAYLKNEFVVNLRENASILKEAILANGAVGVTYYSDKKYLNPATNAYYNPVKTTFNHVVVAVGWDDQYPAENFKTLPPGNGAWLIRNSHSTITRFSEESYFWISYYDTSLGEAAYIYEMADPDQNEVYDNHYYYDAQLHSSKSPNATKAANVFTSVREAEELSAVQFDASGDAPGRCRISVYRNLTDADNPESGELAAEAVTETQIALKGRYTIPLKKPVPLTLGETFAVVVETDKPIDREACALWKKQMVMDVSMHAQESFYFTDGVWTDLAEKSYDGMRGNLCIRALTNTSEDRALPDQVTNLMLRKNTAEELSLSWSAAADAERYEIRRRIEDEPKGTYLRIGTVPAENRSFVDLEELISHTCSYLVVPIRDGQPDETGASPVVRVKRPLPEVREVRISDETLVLALGEIYRLAVHVLPDKADSHVNWVSGKPSICKVREDGMLEALAPGQATIRAMADNGVKAYCKVTVTRPEVREIRLSMPGAVKPSGTIFPLKVRVFPKNAADAAIIWSSSDKKIATVDENGLVTAIKAGACTIIAKTANGTKDYFNLTVVRPPVGSVTISETNVKLNVGLSLRLTAAALPRDALDRTIHWKSSNREVAAVTSKGKVTAVRCGTCTITAYTDNGTMSNCKISVKQLFVYECSKDGIYRYTADPALVKKLKSQGWTYRKAFRAAGKSSKPVYQIFDPKTKRYAYTASRETALAARKAGCKASLAFYGSESAEVPVYELCEEGAKPVYIYTASRKEVKAKKNAGWTYRGIAWHAERTTL